MLANALFILLLIAVLFGLYSAWQSIGAPPVDGAGRSSGLDAESTDPAGDTGWRRLLLQPHLGADTSATPQRTPGGDVAQRPAEASPDERENSAHDAAHEWTTDAPTATQDDVRPAADVPAHEAAHEPADVAAHEASRDTETFGSPQTEAHARIDGASTTPFDAPSPAPSASAQQYVPDSEHDFDVEAAYGYDLDDEQDDEEELMEATVDIERFEALEREVEALREVNERTLALERRIASMDERPGTVDTARADSAVTPVSEDAAPHQDHFTVSVERLRDEIALSALDPIARRRLMSELETYRLRGSHDDGLLASVRSQLQRASASTTEGHDADSPTEQRAAHVPSLFQSERPRDESERLRADLALRKRQLDELRSELARSRDGDGPSSPFERVPGRDDLKVVRGIGKRMERLLNELGVTTLAQLAAFEQRHIAIVADRLRELPDDIEAENWVGQARALLDQRRRQHEMG